MAFLDLTIVNVALPHLGRDLHATVSGLQWTVTGYTLTLAAFVLLGGALGDRYGRRRVFLLGVGWFTVASVLCGLSPTIGVLVAVRALQGCGGAMLTPGSLALVQASFDERDRGRAIGAWSGLAGVSTAIGPFVGGWLIDALSWRWIFFLNVPVAAVAVACAARYVPESRGTRVERFDLLGALLAAAGLGGTTYALIQHAWPPAVVGLAGLAAFVVVERRRGDAAMLPPRLFASAQFTALNVVTFFVYAGLSGIAFFLIVELQTVAGYSALVAGTTMLPLTVLLLAGSARVGARRAGHDARRRAADHGGPRGRAGRADRGRERGEQCRGARCGAARHRHVAVRGRAHRPPVRRSARPGPRVPPVVVVLRRPVPARRAPGGRADGGRAARPRGRAGGAGAQPRLTAPAAPPPAAVTRVP